MNALPPSANKGESRLRQLAARFREAPPWGVSRPEPSADREASQWDCRQPDAPPDLSLTHGLRLTAIEARLEALEKSVSNQNRLLLVGILALVGELAKQVLKP